MCQRWGGDGVCTRKDISFILSHVRRTSDAFDSTTTRERVCELCRAYLSVHRYGHVLNDVWFLDTWERIGGYEG